ncbi:hypothetical protein AMTRI_Chr13g83840 [Amborella trichopoda]
MHPMCNKLQRELRQNIQEFERILRKLVQILNFLIGDLLFIERKLQNIDEAIAKAKTFFMDQFGAHSRYDRDEAYFNRKQSAFLWQLAVQSMPKLLHCMNLVFLITTDRQNYVAMRKWSSRSTYASATVHIQNIEDLNLNPLGSSEPPTSHRLRSSEFPFSSTLAVRSRYLTLFSHSHFYLPQIFPNLQKMVVSGDNVVFQRDLSSLWNLDLGGKVMGSVDYFQVRLGILKNFLISSQFGGNACTWISELNIIDLEMWREQNLTGTYRRWLQLVSSVRSLYVDDNIEDRVGEGPGWRGGALPASLNTFHNMTFSLDNSWLVFGLYHDHGINKEVIKKLAVAIPSYERYWRKHLKRDERFMGKRNVNG